MVFSSVTFLFLFLPLVLVAYYLSPRAAKNYVLLAASLLFYTWGSGQLVLLLLFSIGLDYGLGLVQARSESQRTKLACVWISLITNLGLLGFFKYTNFLLDNVNSVRELFSLEALANPDIVLPVGISFYTFQTLSYQIDLYRGKVRHQRSLADFSLFVALFPQLIAGPIVRYRDIAPQLSNRVSSLDAFTYGAYRFVVGLTKKIVIADGIARCTDSVFATSPEQLSTGAAWLGATGFLLQIYFDFSGYSDMAIGLGSMFGFRIRENFRYPYVARSITGFWQRWHMSLTTWFRDYVYVPLRHRGESNSWKAVSVYVVFLLCGLWHGAQWNFVVFGLYFGSLLVVEHVFLLSRLSSLPRIAQHVYVLGALIVGLVFFRSPSLGYAGEYLSVLVGFDLSSATVTSGTLLDKEIIFLMMIGALFCTPVVPETARLLEALHHDPPAPPWSRWILNYAAKLSVAGALAGAFAYSVLRASAQTYKAFVYFQF